MKTYTADRMQIINGIFRKHNNWKGYIFRGQELSEWGLTPSLFRQPINDNLDYSEMIAHHLDRFIIASRGLFDKSKFEDEYFDLWAIGQHNDLFTPLLDWSASPYIALFFAFCNEREIKISKLPHRLDEIQQRLEQPRTIFCLNAKLINKKYYEAISMTFKKEDPTGFKSYVKENFEDWNMTNHLEVGKRLFDDDGINLVDDNHEFDLESLWEDIIETVNEEWIRIHVSKSGENRRMIAQRGVFTFLADPTDLIDFIGNKYGDTEDIIARVDIEEDARNQILKELANMNITHTNLFPDIQGASKYVNYKYRLHSKLSSFDTNSWI